MTGVVTAAAALATGLRAGHAGRRRGRRPGGERGRGGRRGARADGAVAGHVRGGVRHDRQPARSSPTGRVHAFCHAVPGRWHLMSVMLSAAGSLRWFRDAIAPGSSFDDLVGAAAGVPAGSDGLLFLPYLSGERCPHPDPLARGAFVGLTLGHDRRHLDARGAGGRRLRAARRDGPDGRCRDARAGADPGVRRGYRQPGLAADPRGRAGCRDRHAQHDRGRGVRGRVLAAVGAGWFATVEAAADSVVRATPAAQPGPDAAAVRGGPRPVPHALPGARARVPPDLTRGGPDSPRAWRHGATARCIEPRSRRTRPRGLRGAVRTRARRRRAAGRRRRAVPGRSRTMRARRPGAPAGGSRPRSARARTGRCGRASPPSTIEPRVEDVDEAGQPDAEPAPDVVERGERGRASPPRRRRRTVVDAGATGIAAGSPASAQQRPLADLGLPAPRRAAAAGGAGRVDRHVPDLAAVTGGAGQGLPPTMMPPPTPTSPDT